MRTSAASAVKAGGHSPKLGARLLPVVPAGFEGKAGSGAWDWMRLPQATQKATSSLDSRPHELQNIARPRLRPIAWLNVVEHDRRCYCPWQAEAHLRAKQLVALVAPRSPDSERHTLEAVPDRVGERL
jgi:hypothetical protein